jgi:hypothetical protein
MQPTGANRARHFSVKHRRDHATGSRWTALRSGAEPDGRVGRRKEDEPADAVHTETSAGLGCCVRLLLPLASAFFPLPLGGCLSVGPPQRSRGHSATAGSGCPGSLWHRGASRRQRKGHKGHRREGRCACGPTGGKNGGPGESSEGHWAAAVRRSGPLSTVNEGWPTRERGGKPAT